MDYRCCCYYAFYFVVTFCPNLNYFIYFYISIYKRIYCNENANKYNISSKMHYFWYCFVCIVFVIGKLFFCRVCIVQKVTLLCERRFIKFLEYIMKRDFFFCSYKEDIFFCAPKKKTFDFGAPGKKTRTNKEDDFLGAPPKKTFRTSSKKVTSSSSYI